MSEYLKLYKVTLQGMRSSVNGIAYGISYVIASNPDEAYQKVKEYVDKHDLGFLHERELHAVELMADSSSGTGLKCLLHI